MHPRLAVPLVTHLRASVPADWHVLCCPNKGEVGGIVMAIALFIACQTWDPVAKQWLADTSTGADLSHVLAACVVAGASVIGGCCRVTPSDIFQLRHMIDRA